MATLAELARSIGLEIPAIAHLQRLVASLIEQRRRELDVQYDRELLQDLGITGEVAES